MKNTKLRKQCADIIRYLRRNNSYLGLNFYPQRPDADEDISSFYVKYNSLADIVGYINTLNIPMDEVRLRYKEKEDYEGYLDQYLIAYKRVKASDKEYFDYLCSLILPSEYEMNEYKQYLMLKNKYEGEQ